MAIKVIVYVSSNVDRVLVTSQLAGTKVANKSLFAKRQYEAHFTVKIPKTQVLVSKFGEKEFVFKVEITDASLEKITDTKTLKVNVDTTGRTEDIPIEETTSKKECYCLSQGLVDVTCDFLGKSITDDLYSKLADQISVEKAVLVAIGIKESKSNSFIQDDPKKATILLERHFVYRFIKEKYGVGRADSLQLERPDLCNTNGTPKGGYGTKKEQITRLEDVKKWDSEIGIKSCSWGKFQIMGEYFERPNLYEDAESFEQAMNQCEIQQFQYFKAYIITTKGGKLLTALREKNWEKIAELYNGKNWKKVNPDYATKLEKYYEESKGF